MVGTWENSGSFLFGNVDMFKTFGIKLTEGSMPKDVLLPDLRSRKQTIPLRHGAYDYGAKYYEERGIQIECVTNRVISRDDSRELAYVLSKKSEIRFWTEPGKYYIGRVYEAPSLEQLRNVGNRFPLIFVCEPFAYGATKTENFVDAQYTPSYHGTAPTPTYIVIENTGEANAVNLVITQTIKKENN